MFRVALISKPVFSAMRNSEVFFLFLKLLTRETPCSPAIWVITSSTSLFGIFISASSGNPIVFAWFTRMDQPDPDSLPLRTLPTRTLSPHSGRSGRYTQEPLIQPAKTGIYKSVFISHQGLLPSFTGNNIFKPFYFHPEPLTKPL